MLFRQLLSDREIVIILHSAVTGGGTTGHGHGGSSGVCHRDKGILILGATGISRLYHFSCALVHQSLSLSSKWPPPASDSVVSSPLGV